MSLMELLRTASEFAPALNTGGLVVIGGLALRLMQQLHNAKLENRRVTIDENKAMREGLQAEVEGLRNETRDLRSEIAALRSENLELRAEYRKSEITRRELVEKIGELKDTIRQLYSVIDGLRREEQQRGNSTSAALLRAYPPDIVPDEIKRIIEEPAEDRPSRRSRRKRPASTA